MKSSFLVNKRFYMLDTFSTVKRLIKNKFSKYSENVKLWTTTTKHPTKKQAHYDNMALSKDIKVLCIQS